MRLLLNIKFVSLFISIYRLANNKLVTKDAHGTLTEYDNMLLLWHHRFIFTFFLFFFCFHIVVTI